MKSSIFKWHHTVAFKPLWRSVIHPQLSKYPWHQVIFDEFSFSLASSAFFVFYSEWRTGFEALLILPGLNVDFNLHIQINQTRKDFYLCFMLLCFNEFHMARLGMFEHKVSIVQPIACILRWELDSPMSGLCTPCKVCSWGTSSNLLTMHHRPFNCNYCGSLQKGPLTLKSF